MITWLCVILSFFSFSAGNEYPTTSQIQCPYPNTEYKSCAKPCEPSCDNRDPICIEVCVAGCFCKDGYIRDSGDNCIPINECPNSCGENETYLECGTCDATCEGEQSCTTACVKGCFCLSGFVRDSNGKCIHPSMCPKKRSTEKVCTGINEVWRKCFGGCDPTCTTPSQVCEGCVDGCFCKDDYYRNHENKCVTLKECQTCEGPNEVFTDCLPCQFEVCHLGCMPGCICKEGFKRNNEGICVKQTSICNRANEEFKLKGTACQPTCDNRNPGCTKNYVSGCFCIDGFIRDNNKAQNCIPIEHCPQKCKENEEFTTCGPCEPTCDNLNPICTLDCKVGCLCKKGFVRDPNGNCILARMCPQQQCTGPNEEYSECSNPCPPGAVCIAACIPGCVCKKGFERKDGVCVEENIPIQCTGLNEEFAECLPCPPGQICPAVCRPGCVCKEGFVRRYGVCVKKRQSIQCTGPNEEFTECLPNACPPGRFCAAVCRPGCVCKRGFTRRRGVCVRDFYYPKPSPRPTYITRGPTQAPP